MNQCQPSSPPSHLNLWYGTDGETSASDRGHHALRDINLEIPANQITALIGPSGCGKSTFLKTLNRMNDLVPGVRIQGEVRFDRDTDLYHAADGCDLAAQAGGHGVPEGQSVSHEHL